MRLRRKKGRAAEASAAAEGQEAGRRKKRRKRRLAKDRKVEAIGVAFVTFGFLVTVLTWAGMRTATNPAYQLPILASGGLTAIGCFIVGGLLLVGGMVMTRFARLEKARPTESPALPAEMQLPEEVGEAVASRETVPASQP